VASSGARPTEVCPHRCFRNARGHSDQAFHGRHLPGVEVISRLVGWKDFQCAGMDRGITIQARRCSHDRCGDQEIWLRVPIGGYGCPPYSRLRRQGTLSCRRFGGAPGATIRLKMGSRGGGPGGELVGFLWVGSALSAAASVVRTRRLALRGFAVCFELPGRIGRWVSGGLCGR
jgi:hypothetical protein